MYALCHIIYQQLFPPDNLFKLTFQLRILTPRSPSFNAALLTSSRSVHQSCTSLTFLGLAYRGEPLKSPLVSLSIVCQTMYNNVIIMYIYHALTNALSAHMIHINLNMIFYTHVEHSPTKTIYIKNYYYIKTKQTKTHYKHTHTHACTHAHTRMHTHTHAHARTHTYTHND